MLLHVCLGKDLCLLCDFGTHLLSGMVSMVMVLRSFFVASLAQCMAVLTSFSL